MLVDQASKGKMGHQKLLKDDDYQSAVHAPRQPSNASKTPSKNLVIACARAFQREGQSMNHQLKSLSDSHLMNATETVLTTLRRVDLALLEHLAEIEIRELHLKSGYSSMFKMCTDKFRLSEASAYRRVAAARLIRKFPMVKVQFLSGDVSMCTLAMVAGKLGDLANDGARVELLAEVAGKSKSQVEEILAQRSGSETAKKRDVIKVMKTMRAAQKPLALTSVQANIGSAKEESTKSNPLSPAQLAVTQAPEVSFRIAFTASAAFHQKLQKARDLLKHKHPSGSLEAVLEEALDHLIKSRDLSQKKSRQVAAPTNPRHLPASVRRQVVTRDGGRCTFTSADGHRCHETGGLEFEHRVPFAYGGSSVDRENIELLCRSHNALRARQEFSKARLLSGLGQSRSLKFPQK